jgi:hypothetical protein
MENILLQDIIPLVQQTSLDGPEEEEAGFFGTLFYNFFFENIQWVNLFGIP